MFDKPRKYNPCLPVCVCACVCACVYVCVPVCVLVCVFVHFIYTSECVVCMCPLPDAKHLHVNNDILFGYCPEYMLWPYLGTPLIQPWVPL